MLSKEEEAFIEYWQQQRVSKKRFGFNIGFTSGALLVAAIFISMLAGWHRQASMVLRNDFSTIVVIALAGVCIVVFMSFFAKRYQREQNEQRYQELLAKKKKLVEAP